MLLSILKPITQVLIKGFPCYSVMACAITLTLDEGTMISGLYYNAMKQHSSKSVSNCLNTKIYSYFETFYGQSSIL
jgi:hypothetical protein